MHPEHLKATKKAYYGARSDILSAKDKAWRKAHLNEARAKDKAYRETHIGVIRATNRKATAKYTKTAKGKANHARFDQTDKGKVLRKKHKAKRRALGFLELNDHFDGSEGHHIDKEFVIYIPKEMHRSVYHNVFTGQGMGQINALALNFAYRGGM